MSHKSNVPSIPCHIINTQRNRTEAFSFSPLNPHYRFGKIVKGSSALHFEQILLFLTTEFNDLTFLDVFYFLFFYVNVSFCMRLVGKTRD